MRHPSNTAGAVQISGVSSGVAVPDELRAEYQDMIDVFSCLSSVLIGPGKHPAPGITYQ